MNPSEVKARLIGLQYRDPIVANVLTMYDRGLMTYSAALELAVGPSGAATR